MARRRRPYQRCDWVLKRPVLWRRGRALRGSGAQLRGRALRGSGAQLRGRALMPGDRLSSLGQLDNGGGTGAEFDDLCFDVVMVTIRDVEARLHHWQGLSLPVAGRTLLTRPQGTLK